MQTEVLKEFIVVAQYLNFRKAAEVLHISQPALSSHISSLEREIGFQIFDRDGTTSLTPAGAHFYSQAQQILNLVDKSIRESQEIARQDQPVRLQFLGRQESIVNKLLPRLETPFHIVPLHSNQKIFTAIKSNKADVLVATDMPTIIESDEEVKSGNYRCIPVGNIPLSYIVSSLSPLAAKESLCAEDFKEAEVLAPFGVLFDYVKDVAMDMYGTSSNLVCVQDPSLPTDSNGIPLGDVGKRILVQYRSLAHESCQGRADLVAIDKLDGKSYEATEYLLYRSDDPNPNVFAFVEEVQALAIDG